MLVGVVGLGLLPLLLLLLRQLLLVLVHDDGADTICSLDVSRS